MTIFPNAKINLGLNVTERRPDGYHNLETVFYPIPVCDTLRVEAGDDPDVMSVFPAGCPVHTHRADSYTLHTGGIDIDCPAESNLVIKVLRRLQQDFTLPRLTVSVCKQIPSGAGLGGGSADAAFMMKLLNEQFRLGMSEAEMEERITPLGADCAFFIRNRPTLATGIGNVFSPVSLSLKGWHLVLVKPDVFVSTREAYAGIRPQRAATPVAEAAARPVEEWRDALVNDFEQGIFALHPDIAAVKERLYEAGAVYAAMSGSGSAVFGLFRAPLPEAGNIFSACFCRQYLL